jgi:dihydroxyacetone kinase-like predicted kinase
VTYAARASEFDGASIAEGDYLALQENRLFGTERELPALLRRVAEAAPQQEAEFITVYYGAEVEEAQAQEVYKMFTETCPNAEVSLLSGGQPIYFYLIAAE